jgi:hypothetical protein
MIAKAMEERQHRTGNEAQEVHADWSTLVARAVDDVSRILHSEVDLLHINLSATLRAQTDYALATLAMVAAFICAAVSALAALILLLHESFQWWHGLPWWQCFAIASFLMFLVGIAIRRLAGHRPQLSSRSD